MIIPGVAEDQMDSETTLVNRSSDPNNSHSSKVDDHETAKVRANDMERVVATYKSTSCEISANVKSMIHPTLQPHTSPLGDETHLSFSLTLFEWLTIANYLSLISLLILSA